MFLFMNVLNYTKMNRRFGRFSGRKIGFRVVLSLILSLSLYTCCKYSRRQYSAEFDNVIEVNSPDNIVIEKYTYRIAIGLAISTKGFQNAKLKDLPIFTSFFTSLCNTASIGYNYTVYIGYDFNDPVLSNIQKLNEFHQMFQIKSLSSCQNIPIVYKLIKVNYSGKPTWVQNDVMQIAYLEGNDFFYRLNDDVYLNSNDWSERYINTLQSYKPSYLGVVGPTVQAVGGNKRVLTFDFVHRTHLDIFGYYYPREFPGWFGDDWITHVYQPFNSVRLKDVSIIHSRAKIRYHNRAETVRKMDTILRRDKDKITDYVILKCNYLKEENSLRNAISMDISDYNIDNIYGAVRNALKSRLYMKDYSFFLNVDIKKISKDIISTFNKLNITLITPDNNRYITDKSMGKFLPLLNRKLDYLHIRHPLNRFSKMDETLINEFLASNKSCQILYDCSDRVERTLKLRFLSFNLRKIRKIIPSLEDLLSLPTNMFTDKLHSLLQHDCLLYYKQNCKNTGKSISIKNNHHFDLLDEKFDKNSLKLLA
ncbi:unnamed protein product [Dimorphilus gyrociliatus]|uniref:Uncharacterized protein n=1 Tax=Dimorphilus gyrociliatus TaxID=2664684 RepID=A0A7I8W1D2_9ANNE|nr:unnamed protein product [Dimorphilus gyrociliatus]